MMVASLLLVHGSSYEPPVSYVLLYLVASVGIVTAAVVVPLLPGEQFTATLSGGVYALYAAVVAMMVFFSGGVSSELYVVFFPLLLASALHGSWKVVLAVLGAILFCYGLAMLPGLLEDGRGEEVSALAFYRLCSLILTGFFLAYAARGVAGAEDDEDYADEGDGSLLLECVEEEFAARPGEPVAVILVDPGDGIENLDLLLNRVGSRRIGEPVPVGEDNLFGVVVGEVDDRGVEGAARRVLAAASSLGAGETRAGVAVYPRDAKSADELVVAAGRALEAALEVESPRAIVLAGKGTPRADDGADDGAGESGGYRAAR